MRDLYSSHAAALRDALRHAVERGGMSSLGVLHQGVQSASTLTETDAIAQAARIRRQLERLAPVPRAACHRLRIAHPDRQLRGALLDPTNDVLADQGHVTLAIGRDYTDVSLLRGVILGGGAHQVDVAVNVNAG